MKTAKWWSFHERYSKFYRQKTLGLSCSLISSPGPGHHTPHGMESRSLLLSCLEERAELELFPFTLCFTSLASPLTTLPLASPSNTSFSRKPLFLGVGVWLPDTFDPLLELLVLSLLTGVGVVSPLGLLVGVTGVDTVDRTEMLDFWEFRDGERGDRVGSVSPSAWNGNRMKSWLS